MAGEKDLKVKITGDASQLGKESKAAVGMLNDVKGAAQGLLAGLTGGLLGGGLAGVISSGIGMITERIREAKDLLEEADRLNVDPGTAQWVKNLTVAGNIPVADAMEGGRRARREALRGDPEYTEAFKKLGISLESIRDVEPGSLFMRLVDAMEKFDPAAEDAAERFAALSRVLGGRANADALTPYALGGLFREEKLMGGSGDILASMLGNNPSARFAYKRDFEAPGEFGVGNENKAARMRAENEQREAAVKRSTLTLEQQILAVTAERAKLEREMAQTGDVVKKERIRSDMISLDAEKVRLNQEFGRSRTSTQSFSLPTDDFAQRGIDIGGSRRVPAILERHLVELQTLVREQRETRRENSELWR